MIEIGKRNPRNVDIVAHASEPRAEQGEIINPLYAPFLGGLISAGGEMVLATRYLHPSSLTVIHSAIPEVSYIHPVNARLEKLQSLFGGIVGDRIVSHVPAKHSPIWKLTGSEAVGLSLFMREFVPFYQDTINAFVEWKKLGDNHGAKVHLKNRLRHTVINRKVYKELAQNPLFLSGLVFGSKELEKNADIDIKSEDVSLILRLQEEYRGEIIQNGKKLKLLLRDEDAEDVFNIVEPHLRSLLKE